MRYVEMNKIFIIVTLLIALGLTACSDFVSPERFDKSYYTINAILKADSTISVSNPVWIGKTVSIEQLNSAQLFVDNATVTITETAPDSTTMSFILIPVTIPFSDKVAVPFTGTQPSRSYPKANQSVTFYIDPLNHPIQPQYTYKITVDIPGYDKQLWAETTVPKVAELMPNFGYTPLPGFGYTTDPNDSTIAIPFEQVDVNYPVTIKVEGAQTVNYLVELYCLESFSLDLEYTTVIFGQEHATQDMEANYNQPTGETVRRINILGRFISSLHEGNWYVSLTDYRQAFVFYGRYRVTATVMDDNYFKSKYMPEGYYHGGVHNGLGCFGSASGGVMYTKIVK
jgi:hypothetical protein